MNVIKKLKLAFLSVLLVSVFGCEDKNDSEGPSASQPTITVKLVDAPGDFKAVNVEVVDVMIKMNDDSEDENGWVSLEVEDETINLLDFTGGMSKVLVERFPIPAGTLSQMRLVLGDGNTIVIENDSEEDVEHDLKTPSAQQSGLKLKVNSEIEEGYSYDFILDFDVEKSIVMAGNSDNIILKPVLNVSAEINSGIIEGAVVPTDVPAMASVVIDDMGNDDPEDDLVISAYTNDAGSFALWGVPAGTYNVVVTPVNEASVYGETVVTDVVVTKGETTVIGEPIELTLMPGSVSGTVLGLGEGVVAEALIVIDDMGTPETEDDIAVSVNTDAEGAFLLEEVPAGDYMLTFSAEGYVSQTVEITVVPGEVTNVADVTLVLDEA